MLDGYPSRMIERKYNMERLLEYFTPERYMLDIGVNKLGKKIGGTVEICGKVLNETVKFHAVGLSVKQVMVNGENVKFEVADGVLTLFKVPRGDVTVVVVYDGALNENMEGDMRRRKRTKAHRER